MNLLKILNKNLKCRLIIIHDPDSDFYMLTKTKMHYSDCERSIICIFIFIVSIEHCDQHLCACLSTLVTRRHGSVTWLWRGHGDSVTAAHSNPSPSGGMFAANQVKIITVLRDISMFFSKPYPIFERSHIKSLECGAIINTYIQTYLICLCRYVKQSYNTEQVMKRD